MALGDFTYRLKAQSGDSTPHDELGLAGDLTGGTITLVDMGSGDYAWQFTGQATAAGPSKSVAGGTNGTGVTMAFRIKVPTYGTVNYDKILSYAQTSTHDHLYWGKEGSNGAFSSRFSNITGTLDVGASAIGTTIKTIVLRLKTSTTGGVDDVTSMWVEKVGRSGSTPDEESVNNTIGSYTLDTINAGAGNSCVIQVSDWVIWGEELSDADCAALADTGIRATLDVAGATITLTDPVAVVTGSTASCTITRSTAASGTITYNLTSSDTSKATVPATATIADGQTTGTFNVTGVAAGSSTITATNAADSGETDTATANVSALKGLELTFGQINLTGLDWAFFDTTSPSTWGAPSVQGSGATTNGSGVQLLTLTGTTLNVGQNGMLVVFKQGATRPDDIAYVGIETVADVG